MEFRGIAPATLVDPFVLVLGLRVNPMLRPLDASIKEQLATDHPILSAAAHHFFERAGKRFRPTLVPLTGLRVNHPLQRAAVRLTLGSDGWRRSPR